MATKQEAQDTTAKEVFDYYREKFGKGNSFLWTDLRGKKIKARLRVFHKEDLLKAIDNLALSPWHNGKNPSGKEYNSIEFVFRSDGKTEEWVHKYDEPSDQIVRDLGNALRDNYAIAFKRYMGIQPTFSKDDEQIFYRCANRLKMENLVEAHVPQALMLSFFLLDYKDDKTVYAFLYRMDWMISVAPLTKAKAVRFVSALLKKKGDRGPAPSEGEAINMLEAQGLYYE